MSTRWLIFWRNWSRGLIAGGFIVGLVCLFGPPSSRWLTLLNGGYMVAGITFDLLFTRLLAQRQPVPPERERIER